MNVHASLRYLRMAPRKVRLVINVVRGLNVNVAETRLSFLNKGASEPVLKLLRSAMANAEHNFQLDKNSLIVKTITADGGPTLKRSRPRAFGRSAPIRKRTTHINIVLAPKESKETKIAPVAQAPVATPVKTEKKPARRTTTAAAKEKPSQASKNA